jgi:hypothetical protein
MVPHARRSIWAVVVAVAITLVAFVPAAGAATPGASVANATLTASLTDASAVAWGSLAAGSPGPPGRSGAAMTYDGASQYVLLYGGTGTNGQILNDTWEFDGSTWTPLDGQSPPSGLTGASMAYDPQLQQVILFGGSSLIGGVLTPQNGTYAWNGDGWVTQTPQASPPARSEAALTNFDGGSTGSFVLFGGLGAPPSTIQAPANQVTPGAGATGSGATSSGATSSGAAGSATAGAGSADTATTALNDTWVWDGSK